jgi:hypothetical protein
MRHKEFILVPFLLLGAVACGGSGHPAASPAPVVRPSATAQPLADWYGQAAGPLGELGRTYVDLGAHGATLSQLQATGDAAKLRTTAKEGLAVRPPTGHPELDMSYDRVMDDSLTLADDIDNGDITGFNSDADTALKDMNTLKADLDRSVTPSAT